MSTDARISQLLAHWEERRAQHQTLSAEELCADCPDLMEEVQRRIRALRDMDRGLGQDGDGRPFYAMRFIRGETLGVAIERFHLTATTGQTPGARALALRQLLGRFVAVCNTLAYAHSRGMLHRDLKPSNIMLGAY